MDTEESGGVMEAIPLPVNEPGKMIPVIDLEDGKSEVSDSDEEEDISINVKVNFKAPANGVGGAEWEERSGGGPARQTPVSAPPVKKMRVGGKESPSGQAGVGDVEDIFPEDAPSASGVLKLPAPLLNDVVLTNSSYLKFEGNSANGDVYIEDSGNECGVKSFQRIKLQDWTFNVSREVKLSGTLTGIHVSSLDIHNCRFSGAELWGIAYNLCPNLTRLCLRDCLVAGSSSLLVNSSEPQPVYKEPVRGKHGHLKSLVVSYSELPVSWLELLSHFQWLTSLEVKGCSDFVIQSLLNAITVIRDHGGKELPLPLNHLDIRPFRITQERGSHEKFSCVQKLNLPLKSLIVTAHPCLDRRFVGDTLELHAGTLECLELEETEGHWVSGRMKRDFPCPVELEKLRELKITEVLMESAEILGSAPNLESLSISGEDGQDGRTDSIFEAFDEFETHGVVLFPKLRKFAYLETFIRGADLESFARFMPNVEELRILVDPEDFPTLCEHWKGLKELIVEEYEGDDENLTDEALTGGKLHIEKPGMSWVHRVEYSNITDLKELRNFSCRSKKLTDLSVYHGFLQLPNLQTLTLSSGLHIFWSPKQDYFGEEAMNDLRDKGVKINFVYF